MVCAEVMNDLFRMYAGIDRRVYLRDTSVLADDVSYAAVEAENRDTVFGAVGASNAAVGVEQQRKGQTVLPDKSLVRLGRIDAASEHRDPGGLKARVAVAEGAGLFRASGRVVLGIEVEDQLAAMEVSETDRRELVAADHLAMEIRRGRANREHRRARDPRPKRDRPQPRDREHDRHHYDETHRRPPVSPLDAVAAPVRASAGLRRSAASRGSARRGRAARH